MKKNNVRIKENITWDDIVDAIERIVESYFIGDTYTPYAAEISKTVVTVQFFIEGIEFDEVEKIYTSVINDDEVMRVLNMFYTSKVWAFVLKNVKDKVDYVKQERIHNHRDMDKIIEFCDVIIDSLENFSKLNIGQVNKDDLEAGLKIMRQLGDKEFTAESLSKVLKDAVEFNMDDATAEILDAKNAEIRELKKYKALWEARNTVTAVSE